MTSRRFLLFYFLILSLALFLRLIQLGTTPLSDNEASWALQAFGLARGEHPLPGPQTAYIVPTAWLFFVFGASNFMARFWPALTGALLLLVPWLLRERLGGRAALILALGLAIDPGLWATSRLAGGPAMATTFLALMVVLWERRRYALAGVCAGLTLLAGPSAWFGALTLALSGLFYRWWFRSPPSMEEAGEDAYHWRLAPGRFALRAAWPWAAGVLLFVGTSFGFFPNALGAAAGALPAFLRGGWTPSGVPAWQPALALVADETLPFLFGLIAAVRGVIGKDRRSLALALWALVAFVLTLLYPGRQVSDLTWTILPLWILAAMEINRRLYLEDVDGRVALPLAVFTLTLLTLAWFMLANGTVSWVSGNLLQQVGFQMAAGVLAFLMVSLVMAGLGWDARTAQCGGVWGLLLALSVATFGMGTSAAGFRHPPTVSLWQPSPTIAQADLLRLTVDQISNWSKGHTARLSVRVAELASPALQWLLRDYEVEVLQTVSVGDLPDAILTPEASLAPQGAGYCGQDFLWRQTPRWENASVLDWLRWGLFRSIPQDEENIILWVRPDLTFTEQGNDNAEHYRD